MVGGGVDRFWLWTVTYSRSHVSEVSLASGAVRFGRRFIKLATPNWPLLILAMLGARIVWTKSPKGPRWFSYAFFAFSFLCLCPGFFFREHYFIVWLPAVSIFSGVGGSWLLHFASRWRSGGQSIESAPHQPAEMARRARQNAAARAKSDRCRAVVPGMLRWLAAAMLLVAAAAFGIWWQRDFFFLWTPTRACQETYSMNPFVESCVIADYLRDHTTPDQRVAVVGSEPQVYFYAKRRAATGHIYAYPLVERQPLRCKCSRRCAGKSGRRSRHFWYTFMLPCPGWPIVIPAASSMNGWAATWKTITVRWGWRTSSRGPRPITSGAIRPRTPIPAHRTMFGSCSEKNDRRSDTREMKRGYVQLLIGVEAEAG